MRAELKDCYILSIAFSINSIKKIPLEYFYKQGYWVTDIFGDRCYLVKPHRKKGILRFTCQMRFCELTEGGKEFIKEYAKKKEKYYANYLQGGYNEKYNI